MKSSGWILFGSSVGLSIVLGMIILGNASLKKEAERQVKSLMKTTGKVVNHYRNAVSYIAPGDDEDEIDARDEEWDVVEEQASAFNA